MNVTDKIKSGDGREVFKYNHADTAAIEFHQQFELIPSKPTVRHTEEGAQDEIYRIGLYHEVMPTPRIGKINIVINEAIKLIDEVLETYKYDFEMESVNIFFKFEEIIKALWENREESNANFKGVLVLLMVAIKNSHYQKYNENQYKALKSVLENIINVNINKNQVRECIKLLKDNDIDIYAPIRKWKDYEVEIKKIG